MTNRATSASDVRRAGRGATLLLAFVVAGGLACVVLLQQAIDRARPATDAIVEIEDLYVSAAAAKRASLSFNGLVADWYWMRALQYTGRKILDHDGGLQGGGVQLDDLTALDMRLLAPLLDRATTLDPQYAEAYEFAAVVLPAVDESAAQRLIEKGIAANPDRWRLYHHLGYLHWQGKRYTEARSAYERGSRVAGAPAWMMAMASRMEAEGGSRQTAREVYERLYAEAGDEGIRRMAANRLLWLASLDEREALDRLLVEARTTGDRCPADWRSFTSVLRRAGVRLGAAGAPLDPTGAPYSIDASTCRTQLDPNSKVPYR